MSALALVSELMMGSQVAAAAKRTGASVALVASDEALVAQAETLRPNLVIVDLGHPGLDARALVERLAPLLPPGATLIAFGPHVHKERLAAAREAGFGLVLSRGQFHAEMDEILKTYAT
jgi:CheY-like chemotaxis protein